MIRFAYRDTIDRSANFEISICIDREWTERLVWTRISVEETEREHAGSVPKGKAIRSLRNNSSCLCGSPLFSLSLSLSPLRPLFFFLFFFSADAAVGRRFLYRSATDKPFTVHPPPDRRSVPLSVCLSVNDSLPCCGNSVGRSKEHRSAICSVNRVGLIPSVNAFSSCRERIMRADRCRRFLLARFSDNIWRTFEAWTWYFSIATFFRKRKLLST